MKSLGFLFILFKHWLINVSFFLLSILPDFLEDSGGQKHNLNHNIRSQDQLYSPATLERVAVEAGAGEVSEELARLLEFQIGP